MSHSRKQPAERYSFPDAQRLWHAEGEKTRSLGCASCAFKPACGGLSVSAGFYDCQSLCRCIDREKCTKVCHNRPSALVQSMKEVGGLVLATTPRFQPLRSVSLPAAVPMLYHASRRERVFGAQVVALSVYKMLDRKTGQLRFGTAQALRQEFKLRPDARIVLSGTHTDPSLERVWGLKDRKGFFRALAQLDIELVTTPNYSLICDNPRLDDLHSMKRIAITHAELLEAGIPAALHVNARTEFDYARWAKLLDQRAEIEWITVEFGTGAGRPTRASFHVNQLIALADYVSRPVRLLVRGGIREIEALAPHFNQVALLDTSAFLKTAKRQRAFVVESKLKWEPSPTGRNDPLDDLLEHNASSVQQCLQHLRFSAAATPGWVNKPRSQETLVPLVSESS